MKPEQLIERCLELVDQGCIGFLLSGGCDKKGEMLNLRRLLPAVKKIKNETDLIIKLHTGIIDKNLAEEIVAAGIDIASMEVVGSNDSIREIFDFEITINHYRRTLEYLEQADMPFIVPHVCIGLHYGKLKGENEALQIIDQSCDPSSLVFIVFRPTKATVLEDCHPPMPDDVSTVIKKATATFPGKDISLGCIRPRTRYREEIELAALQAGVQRMELPLKKTLRATEKMGYTIKTIHACCALPVQLEKLALTRNPEHIPSLCNDDN
jgi:hypothetical protein